MNVAEALAAGINELQSRPLHKGNFLDPDKGEGVCAIGSVFLGVGGRIELTEEGYHYIERTEDQDHLAHLVWDYLQDRKPPGGTVPGFNDREDTSKEDVILFMKEALHELENNAD